mmetsp:Transcript_24434/g.46302  ORF Transcript_24434/g.46302 Transcript_24434/m.46302 type:complete len:2013 (-) Transcript_24434:435-6473(-)|eukprot:CAMPEP_0114235088 /NCGR_PEP_ID=MMETSP0058-20121206/6057_1 /TAXON_ID=36894 /ORGANISM="Pyramimonas parkeae, CCMP726" /LENGTH=2012 /DNA_ID=CAMNT_0001346813 /DNA_START=68 /DNA_END=6106 /DNA_ORIENTATION=-
MTDLRRMRDTVTSGLNKPRDLASTSASKLSSLVTSNSEGGLENKKLKQAVSMAYDMFVGNDLLEHGPIPPGQVLMLTRVLPHIAAALGKWRGSESDDEMLAHQAVSVLARLVLSSEGANELLAHPSCASYIMPQIMFFCGLKESRLTDNSLRILQHLAAYEEGSKQMLESPQEAMDGTMPDVLVYNFLGQLAHQMHKQSNVKASSAVKTLMALSEGGHDEHLLSAVANVHISVFKNLCLGLSRRASERKEIGLQAATVLTRFLLEDQLQFRLQEVSCLQEAKVLLLTLLHTMNNTTLAETPRLPVLKRCVHVMSRWTCKPTGLLLLIDSGVSKDALLLGLSNAAELMKASDSLAYLGHVAQIVENLLGHAEFCRWLCSCPAALNQAFRLVHSFLMVQDTAICATGLDLLSNMLEVPAVAVCMAREVKPQPDFVVQALVGPVSSSEIEIQRGAVRVFHTLTASEAWAPVLVKWLAAMAERASGQKCFERLVLSCVHSDVDVSNYGVETMMRLVVLHGPTLFRASETLVEILMVGLRSMLSFRNLAPSTIRMLAAAMSWPRWVELVCKRLVYEAASSQESEDGVSGAPGIAFLTDVVIELAEGLFAQDQDLMECSLAVFFQLCKRHCNELTAVNHEALYTVLNTLQTGEVFRNDTRLKVVVLEVMTLMADTDAGSKVVCGWLKHEEPELREGLLSFLCDCVEDWECTAGATPPRYAVIGLALLLKLIKALGKSMFTTSNALLQVHKVLTRVREAETPFRDMAVLALCVTATSSLALDLETRAFGCIFMELLMLLHEPERASHLDGVVLAMEQVLRNDAWKACVYNWIQLSPELHYSSLMASFALVLTEFPLAVRMVATALVKMLTSNAGLNCIVRYPVETQERVMGGLLGMMKSEVEELQLQTVALEAMRRYLLQVDLETLTPSVVKVILSGLAAIQANNQLSRTQSASSKQEEVCKLVSVCVLNFLGRKSLHDLMTAGEEDLSQMGALALSWVLSNCAGDLLKSAVEMLVNTISGDEDEVATSNDKDLFNLPVDTQQILLSELRKLCVHEKQHYRDVGIISLMSLAIHPSFLDLPLAHLYPLINVLRQQTRSTDAARCALVAELLTSLVRSEKLQTLPEEVSSSLMAALAMNLGQSTQGFSELATDTLQLVTKNTGASHVPTEIMTEILNSLRSLDHQEVSIGLEAMARISSLMKANVHDQERVLEALGLLAVLTQESDHVVPATHATGALVMSMDTNSFAPDVLQLGLRVLYNRMMDTTDVKGACAALAQLGRVTQVPSWTLTLTAFLEQDHVHEISVVNTVGTLLDHEDEFTSQVAKQVLSFLIDQGFTAVPNVTDRLMNNLVLILMAEDLEPSGKHTLRAILALGLIHQWVAKYSYEKLMRTLDSATLDLCGEALLTAVMSQKGTVVEPALLITRAMLSTKDGAATVFAILGGEVGEKCPEVYLVILRQYLKLVRVDEFLDLKPSLLAKLGLVLIHSLQNGSAQDTDNAVKIVHTLMQTTGGAAFSMEVLLSSLEPLTSYTAMCLISKYMDEHSIVELLHEPEMFGRLMLTLGSAAEIPGPGSDEAHKVAKMIADSGADSNWSIHCVAEMLDVKSAALTGVTACVLEGWLSSEDSMRKINKLSSKAIFKLLQFAPKYAASAESPHERQCLSRMINTLVPCREMMSRCIPVWLGADDSKLVGVAMRALSYWVSKAGMNALVDFCPEAISAAVGSVVRCGDDTELYMPTATFVTQLMHSTRAIKMLTKSDNKEMYKFIKQIVVLLDYDNQAVAPMIMKALGEKWDIFVILLVEWFGDGSEANVAPKSPGESDWFSGLWFSAATAKKEAPDTVSQYEARLLILDLLRAVRKQTRSSDIFVLGSAISVEGVLCETEPCWMSMLCADATFAQDLSACVEVLCLSNSTYHVWQAATIIQQLTCSDTGRDTVAKMLLSDKAIKMIKALKTRSQGQNEGAVKARQAFYNLMMEGNATWQHWLSQADPDTIRANKLANLKIRASTQATLALQKAEDQEN